MTSEILPPVTPGEVLHEEFMVPFGLSARALARELDVPPNRITAIVNGTRTSPVSSPFPWFVRPRGSRPR